MEIYVDIRILILLVLFCNSKIVAEDSEEEQADVKDCGCEVVKPKEPKIDFGNLELNQNLLKGVRWAIEQEQKRVKIKVYHAIEVVDISKVDVDTMSVRLEIFLQQRWDAISLTLPEGLFQPDDSEDTFIRASPAILDSLWSPDSFIPFARETKIASFTTSQSVVNIFKNKTIIYKARMHTVLGCAFSFHWYPLDKQSCDLTIESFKFSSDMVSYLWEDQQKPVVMTELKLLQYDMVLPLQYGNGSAPRWGTSGCFIAELATFESQFAFERQLAHHIIQVFTPTILVVILSWFSFWLGLDAVPGRVSLLITCMLTLVTMHTGLKGSIPPVNYIKMMDIWMVCCMAFVFAACLEFVVVKYLHWKKQQESRNKDEQETAMAKYKTDHKILQKTIALPDAQKVFNPYLEFYKNMNDKGLLSPEVSYQFAMMQKPPHIKSKPAWQDIETNSGMITSSDDFFHQFPHQFKSRHPEEEWPFVPKKRPTWVIIDRVARIGFPLVFGIFNAVYWPVLKIGAANQ